MEKIIKDFIKENIKLIIEENLNEQVILHIITLFDAQQLEKEQLVSILQFFTNEKNNYFENVENNNEMLIDS